MSNVSQERLNAIRQALEAATPGPWEFRKKKWTPGDGEWADKEFCVGDLRHEVKTDSFHTILEPQKNKYGQYDLYAWNEPDANLIANAPEWLAILLNEVQLLEAERDRYKAALEFYADEATYDIEHLDRFGYIIIDKDHGERARKALEGGSSK
jgi:hypothetical protein